MSKLDRSKEWWMDRAKLEGDQPIGAVGGAVRQPLDLPAIKARCKAAGEWPNNRVPLCSIGSPHQWLPEAVEAFCVAARTDIPALVARVRELEDGLRDIRDNYDCDESAHRYGTRCRCCVARALLGEEKPHG